VDLQQFVGILRSRWRFIVVTILLGALITVGVTLATPMSYASRATIFVSTPQTGVIDYQGSLTAQQRTESYAQLAMDTDLLQQVSARLSSGVSASDLAKQVTLTVADQTLLLQVDVTADSPELAQQIATVMSDEIIRMVKRLETPADSDVPAPIIARLASKATLNRAPVAPNIPLNVAAGLALSVLAGIAGALVRDLLDNTVKSNEDVEAIAGSTPMVSLPFDSTVKEHPLTSDDASGALNEAFRVLRTNLQFTSLDAGRQTIVVTSSVPDEGKTFVATNLAISLAKAGRRVLLLDADMRNPNVAQLIGLDNSVGFVTVLLGRASVQDVIQEHATGVSFMGTGPQPPNPAEVLDTKSMRELLATVRDRFDIVVIDAPPLLPVADAAILLTEVDGALLLVRHGATHREQLRNAVARVDAVHGKLVGTIINRAPMRSAGDYGYGYGYGYGGYGSSHGDRSSAKAGPKGRRARR
jgi:receptor protein-tyrosine kinase